MPRTIYQSTFHWKVQPFWHIRNLISTIHELSHQIRAKRKLIKWRNKMFYCILKIASNIHHESCLNFRGRDFVKAVSIYIPKYWLKKDWKGIILYLTLGCGRGIGWWYLSGGVVLYLSKLLLSSPSTNQLKLF